jgi:hypothetical protein
MTLAMFRGRRETARPRNGHRSAIIRKPSLGAVAWLGLLLLLLFIPWFALRLGVAEPKTRTERVKVVRTHVGGKDEKSGDFAYHAPSGWRILDHRFHDLSRGGDAEYGVKSATESELIVHWRVQSRTEGVVGITLNTITGFLELEMTVTLAKTPQPAETWPKIVAVDAGLVLAGVVLVIAVFIPEPTGFQELVFRLMLSFAAAAFGAVLPGFLELHIRPITEFQMHAAGAIAFGVIVYLINPPRIITRR